MKLSAVIATANRAAHLEDVFETCITQSRLFDEIIIADGSSNDDTKQVVEEWVEHLGDSEAIRYISGISLSVTGHMMPTCIQFNRGVVET